MALGGVGTVLKAEDIATLATTIKTKASDLQSQLDTLRTSVTRADEFTGTAANNYDEFLGQWSTHQAQMVASMNSAADLLQQLVRRLAAVKSLDPP